jgi:hypothetical protein
MVPGLQDAIVFLDLNHNGVWDPGEPFTKADEKGEYVFRYLKLDKYDVRVIRYDFYDQTAPQNNSAYEVFLSVEHQIETDKDFGIMFRRLRRRSPETPGGPESRLPEDQLPPGKQQSGKADAAPAAGDGTDAAPIHETSGGADESSASTPGMAPWLVSLLPFLAKPKGRKRRQPMVR